MHFYTLLLLKSWLLLGVLMAVDIWVLPDFVEKFGVLHTAAGLWTLANLMAVPVWFVWAVWTL